MQLRPTQAGRSWSQSPNDRVLCCDLPLLPGSGRRVGGRRNPLMIGSCAAMPSRSGPLPAIRRKSQSPNDRVLCCDKTGPSRPGPSRPSRSQSPNDRVLCCDTTRVKELEGVALTASRNPLMIGSCAAMGFSASRQQRRFWGSQSPNDRVLCCDIYLRDCQRYREVGWWYIKSCVKSTG